jgi:hypothetical protein
MQYGNTAIILMVIAVVLFVLSLTFVGMYCLNKAVDEKRST